MTSALVGVDPEGTKTEGRQLSAFLVAEKVIFIFFVFLGPTCSITKVPRLGGRIRAAAASLYHVCGNIRYLTH